MIILNISSLGPFYMSLRIIFGEHISFEILSEKQNVWLLFFSFAGPIQLLMTAVLLQVWINFFVIHKSKLAWWTALIATLWIGINDSMAMLVFALKYPQYSFFPLPPFVTSGLLLGLYLIKDHVFETSSKNKLGHVTI